ncbi:MAG TPA: DnaJ domain-containing protein [Candidatus Limnocylindria bacterium]
MALPDVYRVLQVVPDADQVVLNAAFRALALKYHPDRDGSTEAARRMAQLNAAWALVRDGVRRAAYDRSRRHVQNEFPTTPSVRAVPPPPARSASAGTRLEFGRYAGWTLRDLARQDPDYLRWLSRHASGLRYRTEIYQILGRMGSVSAA